MQTGMLKRILVVTLVGLINGSLALMSPVETAWSAGLAEKDKPAETGKAAEKEKQAGKAQKEKPATKEKPAEKKSSKKPKTTQPTQKGRFSEGATKASGAGIVEKSAACFGQAPKIEKVDPDEAKPGDKVTLRERISERPVA